jgi:hypothetical protein
MVDSLIRPKPWLEQELGSSGHALLKRLESKLSLRPRRYSRPFEKR